MNAREEWLNERRSGIGGSDAAAILGLSPWKTPLSVYLEKIGQAPERPDNDRMLWGRLLEPVIRQHYADQTGRVVRMPGTPYGLVRSETHPFMLATIDGFTDDGRILEIKTAGSADGWGEPGTDEVPEYYLPQVQHYLAVTGFAVADVAVLIGGHDFRIYHVEADKEFHDILIDVEASFWRCVEQRVPPPPVSGDDVARLFPKDTGRVVEATEEIAALFARAKVLREQIAALKTELDGDEKSGTLGVMDRIKAYMGDASALLIDGETVATWKASKDSTVTDWEAVARALNAPADLIAQFTKSRPGSRRFLFK